MIVMPVLPPNSKHQEYSEYFGYIKKNVKL